jgi:pimeloyl-ACP methyl ester carboxylesterase
VSNLVAANAREPLTRHLTRVRGMHIHWAEMGQGPPVVLLHGVCDSYRTWLKVARPLSRARRVVMPDMPGHGLSDRPDAPYTVEWYAEVLGEWIDALRLRSFDLVGHSFGGGVAQMLLLSHGKGVRRLALVAPGGLGKEVALGLRLWSMTDVLDRVAQPLMSPSTRIGMAALLPEAEPEEIAFLSWMNAMPGTARALSRTMRAAIDWRGQKQHFFDRAHELPELPPIALYWGDRDTIVPVDHGTDMVARLENVGLTRFESCGHFPHQEHPEAFVQALDGFLALPDAARAMLRDVAPVAVRPRTRWARLWRAVFVWAHRQIAWLAWRLGHKHRPKLPSAP